MPYIYNGQLDAFDLYHKLQEESRPQKPATTPALPALGHALSGATGSAISNLIVFPLDLIITRLQVQEQLRSSPDDVSSHEYTSIQDAIHKIYTQEGGIAAFYTGVFQDTGKSIADAFLFFLAYTFLRERRKSSQSKGASRSAAEELAIGAAAGAFARFFTSPISTIITRKQTSAMRAIRQEKGGSHKEPSVVEIARQIKAEKGLAGFWSGYSSSLILTLNPSITFFLYESFKRSLLPRSRRNNPGARITFLLAALSKAIASIISYPFSVAKARAQASSSSTSSSPSHPLSSILSPKSLTPSPALLATILKATLSHGSTMLIKESIHKFVIQSYFILLKILKRYPSPEELMQRASDSAADKAEAIVQGARDAVERAKESAKDSADMIFDQVLGDVVEESVGVVDWIVGGGGGGDEK